MSITESAGGIVVTGPESINLFRLLAWKGALKLEIGGMTHSRGSVYATIKKELGFKGTRESVLKQLVAHIEKVGAAHQQHAK